MDEHYKKHIVEKEELVKALQLQGEPEPMGKDADQDKDTDPELHQAALNALNGLEGASGFGKKKMLKTSPLISGDS